MRLAMLAMAGWLAGAVAAGSAAALGDGGYYSLGHGVNLHPLADQTVGVGVDGAYGVVVDETGHVFVGAWAAQSVPVPGVGNTRSLDVHADAREARARLDGGLHAEPPVGAGPFGGQSTLVVLNADFAHAQTQGQVASGTAAGTAYDVCVNTPAGDLEASGVSVGAGPVLLGHGPCTFA